MKVGIKIDPYSGVIERLAELAPTMPSQVVECISMIIDAVDEDWHIIAWRDSLRIF